MIALIGTIIDRKATVRRMKLIPRTNAKTQGVTLPTALKKSLLPVLSPVT